MPARIRKTIFVFFAFVILTSVATNSVKSQAGETSQTPLEKARQDYVFQTTKYNETREKYLAAKDNHNAFNTATSKNEAFLKTRDYIVQIHNVYITYLLLINERSNNYDWSLTPYQKNTEHQKIQSEINTLELSKKSAENLKTLEETVTFSQQLKNTLETTILPLAYEILAKSDLAQLTELENLFAQNSTEVENYVKEKLSQKDNQLFLNWQSELEKAKESIKSEVENNKLALSKLDFKENVEVDQMSFEYNTGTTRGLFSPTVDLLREILRFI